MAGRENLLGLCFVLRGIQIFVNYRYIEITSGSSQRRYPGSALQIGLKRLPESCVASSRLISLDSFEITRLPGAVEKCLFRAIKAQ